MTSPALTVTARTKEARDPAASDASETPGDPLLLIPEAAAYARASVPTVRDWIASGRLQAYRPGRRVLIRRSDLDAFIARGAKPVIGGAK